MKKKGLLWFSISIALGLYAIFVFQNLWNWFVPQIFNVQVISFLEMYGLTLIVELLFDHRSREYSAEYHRDILFEILYACIPGDKRNDIMNALEEKRNESTEAYAIKIASGRLFSLTLTLIFGWAIHRLCA